MNSSTDTGRKWFHLSSDGIADNKIKELRQSDYLDVDEPCFSVAPTVWQCATAISTPGRYLIYSVDVDLPESVEGQTADAHFIHEHRITQAILDANGGEISVSLIGSVEITRDILQKLKVAFDANRLLCDAATEREVLWHVQGDKWEWRNYTNIPGLRASISAAIRSQQDIGREQDTESGQE